MVALVARKVIDIREDFSSTALCWCCSDEYLLVVEGGCIKSNHGHKSKASAQVATVVGTSKAERKR